MAIDVPQGWQAATLGKVLARAEGGGTPPRDVEGYWNGDIPWASVKDIVKGNGSIPEETITAAGLANSTSRVVAAGTNIFATRMGVGAVTRYPIDVAINQDLMALTPTKGLDPDYLYHWLRSKKAAFAAVATGTTVKGIRKDLLLSFPLALPPLDEQRRIAEVLRSVDEAITANAFALNQARLLQSCIAEDFLAKHRHDEQVMLRDVVVETGSGWSPGCDPEAARPEEWGILKTSAITWDGYDDSECKRLPDNLEAKPDLAVRANDILITRAGQAYRTGVVAFVFATSGTRMLSDKMIRIRADEAKILPLVLCQVLKGSSVQGQLNPLKSGLTTLTNITQKMIGDVTFPLPAMADQRLFMQAVESVDEQIGYLVREADYLGGLKAALSAALLSGHVRVPA